VIKISGASHFIYNIVGVIAIVVGLLNIKDFFWYGKVFLSEIPRRWRPILQKVVESAVTPVGAFIVGFIVTSFELPCTGGPYFFAIGLLSGAMSQISAIPILLLYNLFFVLPLIAIFLIIYFGVSTVEKTAEWKNRNIKIFHLVAGIIMVLLGVSVLLGVF
jgi:cytochrome c biogenesis protein CcdA